MARKNEENVNQISLNFEIDNVTTNEIGKTVKNQEMNRIVEENENKTIDSKGKKIKKIDQYVPTVSPFINEVNALNSFFMTAASTPVQINEDNIQISTSTQSNYPEITPGYELIFEYDENSDTKKLPSRLRLVLKAINGVVHEPECYQGSCTLKANLPVSLEETTAFFDAFLKQQFQHDIKMSGAIYKNGYAFTAHASEEKIKEIKSDWVRFSNKGNGRELTQYKEYLTIVFKDADDYIQNSSILGLSGTTKDGVTFTTDIEPIKIKEDKNYNPHRPLMPD